MVMLFLYSKLKLTFYLYTTFLNFDRHCFGHPNYVPTIGTPQLLKSIWDINRQRSFFKKICLSRKTHLQLLRSECCLRNKVIMDTFMLTCTLTPNAWLNLKYCLKISIISNVHWSHLFLWYLLLNIYWYTSKIIHR